MMNCVFPKLADTDLHVEYSADPISQWEDQYTTVPMISIRPAFWQPSEEELHTAFEQAISDRLVGVNRRLSRLSGPITDSGYGQPCTDELLGQNTANIAIPLPAAANSSHQTNTWQRIALMVCLCLILVMLGFDLMGVLLMYVGR